MSLFRDIQSKQWLYAKGFLFLLLALVAAGLLILKVPRWDVCVLLLICVWASCRAYYFAFYVIEHYVDPNFRYSGLIDFAKHRLRLRRSEETAHSGGQRESHE
ncbi:MAG: hypothetical protein MI861_26020 [Pirellulales bacterium]|nr:hypothetical protein [Pirellulales bacterium]